MKKRCLMVILLLLIFTLSMGAINAEDSNQTDAVGVDDSNPKSFSELNEDIYNHMVNGTAELDLGSDYEFVEESDEDYARGISIDGNVTINGHDHVIDCKNVAIAFSLNRSYLCINDLTIRNGNPNMMLINTSKCVLNNVKFIDDDCDNSSNKERL